MNRQGYQCEFWRKRSKRFNLLEWANHRLYLNAFIEAGDFKKSDIVIDVGTGTCIVAHAILPFAKKVIGLDKSQDMLEHSNWHKHISFIRGDILDLPFKDKVFDKVTARLVFHHILEGTQKAMDRCYRVLKRGGKMILSEGIPPSEEVKEDYIKIFKLKEKRLTFMEEDLIVLMKKAGFKNIQSRILWLRQMSVKNWLVNSDLPQSTKNKIFRLHLNARDRFKKAYHMIEKGGDCWIDMKMAILVGEK